MYNQGPKSHCVYELSYPEGMPELAGIVFYVGKSGNVPYRMKNHLNEASKGCECRKCKVIRSIWDIGLVVVHQIVFESPSDEEATNEERRRIHLHRSLHLTNMSLTTAVYAKKKKSEQEEESTSVSMTRGSSEYLSTQQAIALLELSKQSFYANTKDRLRVYRFDAKRTPWYKKDDILALKSGKTTWKTSIVTSGMYGSWSAFARTEYQAKAELRSIEVATLPDEAAQRFHLPASQQFVKRSCLTRMDHIPICTRDVYYPLELVSDITEPMKRSEAHVVEYLKEKHGLVPDRVKDVYSARLMTFDEQHLFQMVTDEPVLILQRATYTEDKRLIWYSDMILLASWFTHEHEYSVKNWGE